MARNSFRRQRPGPDSHASLRVSRHAHPRMLQRDTPMRVRERLRLPAARLGGRTPEDFHRLSAA